VNIYYIVPEGHPLKVLSHACILFVRLDLKRVMTNLGENLPDTVIREMIGKVDTDRDGKVNFEGKDN